MSKTIKQGIVSWSLVAAALFSAQNQTVQTAPEAVVSSAPAAWTAGVATTFRPNGSGFVGGL